MSINYYGIYISYHPGVDLRCEGLGRHLAAFISGIDKVKNVRFVLICPSWGYEGVIALLKSEGVDLNGIDIIRPKGSNVLLRMYEAYNKSLNKKQKTSRKNSYRRVLSQFILRLETKFLEKLMTIRSFFLFFVCSILFFLPFLLIKLIQSIGLIYNKLASKFQYIFIKFKSLRLILNKIILNPTKNSTLSSFYQFIEQKENQLMINIVNKMEHVKAWYSPTAFWPSFNRIQSPKLICVPDIIPSEFPIEFAILGKESMIERFKQIEKTIEEGEYFVTYSQHIKQTVLVEKYGISSEKIKVIPHAVNALNHHIDIKNADNSQESTRRYAYKLFMSALKKSTFTSYMHFFNNKKVKYLFYASQIRPSKNVLTLLKAYKNLLTEHFLTHKLILTGKPEVLEEVQQYVIDNCLQYDVIFVPGLTVEELAAMYSLADLAVNPSLSEGACPFTFTEALSVNTPVVMADIAVTKEVITDSELQKEMLFDPYDWQNLAKKILWAIHNKEALLEKQRNFYKQINSRTWQIIVKEYVETLESISNR